MSATTATCQHLWERHLEVHNKLERVIRVCLHCGCKEICWARPSFQRRVELPRKERKAEDTSLLLQQNS